MLGHMSQDGQLPINDTSAADDEVALVDPAEALRSASRDNGRSSHMWAYRSRFTSAVSQSYIVRRRAAASGDCHARWDADR